MPAGDLLKSRRNLLPVLLAFTLLAAGCSIRRMAVNQVAQAFAGSARVYAEEEDPELVREALPFALKTIEVLLADDPENPLLLRSACEGFTIYAMAFIAPDAERLKAEDLDAARALEERALKLSLRARDYGLRGLAIAHPGIGEELRRRPEKAVDRLVPADIETIFATASAWGAAISLGLHRPDIVAELPAVRALLGRALEIDEDFGEGSLHEALLVLESLPPEMGGSLDAARFHFQRATALSGGLRASPYVLYATRIAVAAKDREAFVTNLERALAIDVDLAPRYRLQNVLNQRRAALLLAEVEDYFFEDLP